MAGAGWRSFSAGAVLTAAQVQTYLQDQVVQVYASAAARSSALGTAVATGMVSYRADGSVVEFYNGSAWGAIAPSSALTVSTVTAYTAVAGDANDTLSFTSASAVSVVVPDVFSVGDRVDVIRDGSGTVSISAGTGVTTWAGAGTAGTAKSFTMGTQYTAASIIKVAANSYRVIGAVA